MSRVRLIAIVAGLLGGCAAEAPIEWTTAERQDLVVEVDISGQLRSRDAAGITPPGVPGMWNYKISMLAPEGEAIEEGAPIVAFDTTELGRRLTEKTAERDSSEKELEKQRSATKLNAHNNTLAGAEAKAGLRKAEIKADAPAEITASIEVDKARLDLELAQLNVAHVERKAKASARADAAEVRRWSSRRDRAQQRVEEITASIAQMTVAAPRAGTVIYPSNWQGEKKSVGDSVWRAETVLQVVSLDAMEAEGEVDEVDVSRVAVGQSVSLRLDSQADVELRGTIREISSAVRRQSPDNPLKVVKVDIELEAAEGAKLRPGMRFWGKVETARIEDALVLPLSAVVATPQGPVVLRKTATGSEAVAVTLGRRNATEVEVTEGLAAGDEINAEPRATEGGAP